MTDPRAKTAEEVRVEFLQHLAGMADYWATLPGKTPRERCNGLIFSVLVLFDGHTTALPAMSIAMDPHPDDMEYHKSEGENWYQPGQIINDTVMHDEWYNNVIGD